MIWVFAVAFVVVAACATAVVLIRDPLRQAMASGIFGLTLVVLFFLYDAPDVALSMLVVAAFLLPLIELLAVAKTRGRLG